MLRILRAEEEERETIKKTLEDLSEYYCVHLTDKQVEMYIEDLLAMGSDDVLRASKAYRTDWNSTCFPLPAQLRKAVFFSEAQSMAYI